ncbi:MAG TPA: hypothetical protein VIO64_16045 [Pseudobacteroides sp.]
MSCLFGNPYVTFLVLTGGFVRACENDRRTAKNPSEFSCSGLISDIK